MSDMTTAEAMRALRDPAVQGLLRALSKLPDILAAADRSERQAAGLEGRIRDLAAREAEATAALEKSVAVAQVQADGRIKKITIEADEEVATTRRRVEAVKAESTQVVGGMNAATEKARAAMAQARADAAQATRDAEVATSARDALALVVSDLRQEETTLKASLELMKADLAAVQRRYRERVERLEAAMKG